MNTYIWRWIASHSAFSCEVCSRNHFDNRLIQCCILENWRSMYKHFIGVIVLSGCIFYMTRIKTWIEQQDVHCESSILKTVHLLRIWCVATWENLAHKAPHQASKQYLWYRQYTKDICCKKGSGLFHVTCVIERSTPNFNVKCPDVDRFSIF